MAKYHGVSLPKKVIERIDTFLKTDYAQCRGHNSRASVIINAVNEMLTKQKEKEDAETYTSIFDIHGIAAEIEDAKKKEEEASDTSIGGSTITKPILPKYYWQDRHYKIAQESAKKFESHTKDQEVNLVPKSKLPDWRAEDEELKNEFEARMKAGELHLASAKNPPHFLNPSMKDNSDAYIEQGAVEKLKYAIQAKDQALELADHIADSVRWLHHYCRKNNIPLPDQDEINKIVNKAAKICNDYRQKYRSGVN